MNSARRVTLSAALIVLICFFLPWVQVSCLGIRDSVSGLDLARRSDGRLWLIPLLMLVVLLLGFVRRIWEQRPAMFALISAVGGSLSAHLMYRDRVSADPSAGWVAAQMTAWFWLGLASSISVAAGALTLYIKRFQPP